MTLNVPDFTYTGKKSNFFDHPALELLLKTKQNEQTKRACLTRWLERLNQFVVTLKYTARKELTFTTFVSHNPTETAKSEKNYQGEIVINAIAKNTTVNTRIETGIQPVRTPETRQDG